MRLDALLSLIEAPGENVLWPRRSESDCCLRAQIEEGLIRPVDEGCQGVAQNPIEITS